MKESKLSFIFVVMFLAISGSFFYYWAYSSKKNIYHSALENHAFIMDEKYFHSERFRMVVLYDIDSI